MTPNLVEELQRALSKGALSLPELFERARHGGSAWSIDQLRLFVSCMEGFSLNGEQVSLGARSEDDELQEAIVEAVRSFGGRPVPAMEVKKRLPERFIVTDEKIKAIARKSSALEVFGPGLLRLAAR